MSILGFVAGIVGLAVGVFSFVLSLRLFRYQKPTIKAVEHNIYQFYTPIENCDYSVSAIGIYLNIINISPFPVKITGHLLTKTHLFADILGKIRIWLLLSNAMRSRILKNTPRFLPYYNRDIIPTYTSFGVENFELMENKVMLEPSENCNGFVVFQSDKPLKYGDVLRLNITSNAWIKCQIKVVVKPWEDSYIRSQ